MASAGAGTRVLAWSATRMARSWNWGRRAQQLSNIAGRIMPQRIWHQGAALQLAAENAGFENYQELRLSHVKQTHGSELNGEFVGSGYFAFAFHFAFVTGLLFPDFLQNAIDNPGLFYAKEVSSSAVIAAALTYMMVAGHMGVTARAAFRTANLSENIEKHWQDSLGGGIINRAKFCLSVLKAPLGSFPGVIKDGFSYRVDGESPLQVSASGPRLWDGVISKIAWGVSLPLVTLAIFASTGSLHDLPAVFDWLKSFAESPALEMVTRVSVPLAFISSLGRRVTNRGAYQSYVIDQEIGEKREVTFERQFDLTEQKLALTTHEEEE